MRIIGKNICMRLVELTDAEFIVSLRVDKKNKFLTRIEIEDQLKWLTDYKTRESAKSEYYFIIYTKSDEACGAVRVYDFIDNSFCWGSWLLNSGAPATAGIESALLVYEFAFYHLKFNHCHFDVRVENVKVRAFHERMGASILKSDELDVYYELPLTAYESIKPKYSKFFPEQVFYEY
ncbi:MAG: GNAT family N-acetyltransferase [Desulfuromonadaceae bacterium]|nr:GNAT family N-acetyltransferase [Desulfuromonadaceae bacterium]